MSTGDEIAYGQDDHGTFLIESGDDSSHIRNGIGHARENPSKPGHYWFRIVAKGMQQDGRPVEGIKTFHIDLDAHVIEVFETWNGEETARRTRDLDGVLRGSPLY